MLKKIAVITLISLAVLYALLMIPGLASNIPRVNQRSPFAWNQDPYWRELEKRFNEARAAGCGKLAPTIDQGLNDANNLLYSIPNASLDTLTRIYYDPLETKMFSLASMIAACPSYLDKYESFIVGLRNSVKKQSINWDLGSDLAQIETYRLLYGARAALEEIMLQAPPDSVKPLLLCNEEPSNTPFTQILGMTIHSGDILISRGGVATSALIARGSNYQGNFSHAALVYVDPKTSLASIIESHIEKGVTISSLETYLHDKKLRVMILRLRRDLPELVADPMLPHKVAQAALDEARSRHIPYDFEMNSEDNSRKFCSEVVLDPYARAGIKLWAKTSSISSQGVVRWLSYFGVIHFDTQEPSDLEYDPQLSVVAEWRDIETLYKDHIDNAVTDAMLESADRGDDLDYNIFLLPIARVLKAYSWIINRFGAIGPIPEGMSGQAALRNKYYTDKHRQIESKTFILAENFQSLNGYRPPYWKLLQLARQAEVETDKHP